MVNIEFLMRLLNGRTEEADGLPLHTSNHTLMNNVISLKERMLKMDLARAEKKLKEVRILISTGKYELVESAQALENIIEEIEQELIKMVEDGHLF